MIADGPFRGFHEHHYKAIAADPAWSFKVRSPKGEGRSASQHYKTMKLDEICALPVADLAAKDCWLFLWATGPGLRHAFKVMDAWGFKYSAIAFTWVKMKRGSQKDVRQWGWAREHLLEDDLHVGMGFTTRKNTEMCLLGRKGSPKRLSASVREVILAPVREHSRKPDEFYDRVEHFCAGPYIDLFSRQRRNGYDSWGWEVDKFRALNIQRSHDETEGTTPA